MADNVRKVIEVDVKATGEGRAILDEFKKKLAEINEQQERIAESSKKTADANTSAIAVMNRMSGALNLWRQGAAIIGSATQTVYKFASVSEDIKILNYGLRDVGETFNSLRDDAMRAGLGTEEFAKNFRVINQIGSSMGYTIQQSKELTETLALMGKLGGASPHQVALAMEQLKQGLAKGKLAWQDMKLAIEQAPGLIKEMGDAIGKTVPQMITAVQNGEILTEHMFKMTERLDNLRERAKDRGFSMSQEATFMKDAFSAAVDKMNQALGISKLLGAAMRSITNDLNEYAQKNTAAILKDGVSVGEGGILATNRGDIEAAIKRMDRDIATARKSAAAGSSEDGGYTSEAANAAIAAMVKQRERLLAILEKTKEVEGVLAEYNQQNAAAAEAAKKLADAKDAAKKAAEEAAKAEKSRAEAAEKLIAGLQRQAEGWKELTEVQKLAYQLTHEGLKLTEDERTRAFRAAEAIDVRTEAIKRETEARKALEESTKEQANRDADRQKFLDAGLTGQEKLKKQIGEVTEQGRAYAALGDWEAVSAAGSQIEKLEDQLKKLVGKDNAAGLKGFSDTLGIMNSVLSDGKINAKDFVTVLDGIFKNPDLLESVANLGKKILELFSSDGFDFGGVMKGIGGFFGMSAKGNAFDSGLVSVPSAFTSGNGWGTIAEQGPEAILPLTRGADGKLGVQAQGGGGGLQVTVNNNAPVQVSTEERTGPNGRELVLQIEQIVNDGMARGRFDRSLRNSFGVARRGK